MIKSDKDFARFEICEVCEIWKIMEKILKKRVKYYFLGLK